MRTLGRLASDDGVREDTAQEPWAAGRLREEHGARKEAVAVSAMAAVLVALTAFFLAFAPPA